MLCSNTANRAIRWMSELHCKWHGILCHYLRRRHQGNNVADTISCWNFVSYRFSWGSFPKRWNFEMTLMTLDYSLDSCVCAVSSWSFVDPAPSCNAQLTGSWTERWLCDPEYRVAYICSAVKLRWRYNSVVGGPIVVILMKFGKQMQIQMQSHMCS